jgi:phosphoribosyl 1,2-cyclic phosphodiesterase/CheY-like chemotaxis protein
MKTIVIIDDDLEYRTLVGEVLRRNGWHVLLAADGEEGVQLAKTHRPEIVLCDLVMARGNGFEVCRSLRRAESPREFKIAIMSGRDFESDRQAALAAGADTYLTKPIQPDALLVALSRLTGESERAEPEPDLASRSSPFAFRLRFWGVRGSVPTPGPATVQYGGNTSCVEIRAAGQIIIVDAGTGLRLLGRDLIAEFGEEPLELTLLLTHTHWDHIQGLPFFLPLYRPQNRVRILGYEGARNGLASVLTHQMESPFFPVGLREVPASLQIEELKDLRFNLGPVQVATCFAYHPGICVGYRLSVSGRSISFFPDNELRHAKQGSGDTEEISRVAREYARDENRKLLDFVRGTDVLIMDAQYDREEYRQHVGWGHGCVDEVVALALEAEVQTLFLFHHDPDHDDARITQMAAHARQLVARQKGVLQVEAAREGLSLELPAVTR